MTAFDPGMSRTDLKAWAREEFLDAIDAWLREEVAKPIEVGGPDADAIEVLWRERDRAAKLLGVGCCYCGRFNCHGRARCSARLEKEGGVCGLCGLGLGLAAVSNAHPKCEADAEAAK